MHAPTAIFGAIAGVILLAAPASARTWAGGVDMNEACTFQYGGGWSGSKDGDKAQNWSCVDGAGNHKPINVDAYCCESLLLSLLVPEYPRNLQRRDLPYLLRLLSEPILICSQPRNTAMPLTQTHRVAVPTTGAATIIKLLRVAIRDYGKLLLEEDEF